MTDKKNIGDSIAKDDLNIVPFLYTSSSLVEVLTEYSSVLRDSNDLTNLLHANKLIEVKNILIDNKFLSMIRKHYDSLYTATKNAYPNLKFQLAGRRKSVIGTEKKINLYLSQGRDLTDFKDVLAFRFIIFDNSIEICYNLMKTVIDFNLENGFIPCIATQVFQTEGFNKTDFKDVELPEKSYLPPEYQKWVKDYILRPKETGY